VSAVWGQIAGGAGVLGNVVDGGRHLVDGGGGLVGFALLAEHAVLHLVHAAGQARRALIQLLGGAGHGVDHSLVAGLHGIERAGHLPDFIFAGQRDTRRQVAGFLDVQHHVLEGVELAEQEADQQLRGAEHRQHQDQHRHRVVGEALTEHLAQAWRVSEHGDLLPVGAGDHFSAHQRVFAEQGQVIEFDPAAGTAQV